MLDFSIYRSRIDGTWDLTYWDHKDQKFKVVMDSAFKMDIALEAIAMARKFLAVTQLPPQCLLISSVPSNSATPSLAEQVARTIGVPLILAPLDGLSTFDRNHLDAQSAERWSAFFFKNAEPLIDTCLTTSAPRVSQE